LHNICSCTDTTGLNNICAAHLYEYFVLKFDCISDVLEPKVDAIFISVVGVELFLHHLLENDTSQTPEDKVIEVIWFQELLANVTFDDEIELTNCPEYPTGTAVPSPADCNNAFCVMFAP
jgi:hypothetical protein